MVTSVRKLADIANRGSEIGPKESLLEAIGDISEYEPFHNLVLVAPYVQPPRIMKGPNGEDIKFYSTDKGHQEDRFQGKCGLVLAVGPGAFQDESHVKFYGVNVKVGDWVLYRPSDGWEMFLVDPKTGRDGTPCRVLEDAHIKGRVADPAMVY